MVKPTVFAIDPSQEKAKQKAIEAGQVEVPIQTDKLQNEFAVQTQAGARRGCCGSLQRWQKIFIGVVATMVVVGCIGFFTHRMLVRGGWCGTDDSLERGHHRWDEMKGDHDERFGEHNGMPMDGDGRDGPHGGGSEDQDGHDRPGSSSEEEGDHDHHKRPHHGSHDGPDDGPHHGPHGGPHGGPHDGPYDGPHDGPHPGPHHGTQRPEGPYGGEDVPA
eukprot:XP_001176234.2 PREDICTED: serine/threonine-protein phosphatase 1 regulatory subunit 10 isoform X1 [Strongylocentrotus purpuratus]